MNDQVTPVPADEAGRILLVDDDATNLDVLSETLAGPNYRLFVALNGEDALKIARRAKPLIILLDVVMPGIDGYETCRRLKDDPETRDAAVIFLSALSDPKEKVRGFEAGAVDFITKPVQAEEVIARVNTHLTIQRLLRRQVEAASPAMQQVPHDDDPTGLRVAESRKPGASVFRTGDVVAFRFRIVSYLAKGGMGELYEAEDLELRERIALKTILSHISDDERSIQMFKGEVHLARQVTHPNVCRIYDVFRHRYTASADRPASEVVFLSMELLHGETLADRLRREGRLTTQESLPVVRQMAAGLTAAHRVGIVHRDFKSHNVMLVKPASAEGETRVVVTDFGLAWRSTHDENTGLSLSLSTEGEISGTPAYMAPEQVEGGPVTPAADVYALGVVLYEMVTGTWPFVGENPLKVATRRLHEAPPSPRTCRISTLSGKRRSCGVSHVTRKNGSPVPGKSSRRWKEGASSRQLPHLDVTSGRGRYGRRLPWSSWRPLLPVMSCTRGTPAQADLQASRRSRCCRSGTPATIPGRIICPRGSARASSTACHNCMG
jgi:serine/threonine protein kinase/CheY-like chemotaxis protein